MIKASKLSEEKFRKFFSELYFITPKEWLIQKSLDKAQRLLKDKNYNVSQVSELCNFSSLSWFIKQFKSKFGLTPKQFQQNHQKSQ
jgi:AraC-like DNA-binding protein